MRWILLSEYLTLLALILLVSELPASIITNTVIPYQEFPISFRGKYCFNSVGKAWLSNFTDDSNTWHM